MRCLEQLTFLDWVGSTFTYIKIHELNDNLSIGEHTKEHAEMPTSKLSPYITRRRG